jgi:hypothetical protein
VRGQSQGTGPWGTTQIVWIDEISETASLHRRTCNHWIHSAIMACGSTDLICEEGRQTAAVWTPEPSIKPRWRTDILSHRSLRCSTGHQEFLSPHPNQGRRRVQNRISHPVPAVQVPSHAVRVDERTSCHTTKLRTN